MLEDDTGAKRATELQAKEKEGLSWSGTAHGAQTDCEMTMREWEPQRCV